MEEQDPGELPGGVEVGPVDSGSTIRRIENEGLKRRVERSKERKIRWVVSIFVFGVDGGSFSSLPLVRFLARHFPFSCFGISG